MESVNEFWVRGIGAGTYKAKGLVDTFSVDDLWGIAKQFENFPQHKRGGVFLPQYDIPFFTDKYPKKREKSHDNLCAVVGEDRIRVLINPDESTESGNMLCWCRDNQVPLYSFAVGYVSRESTQVGLEKFGVVLNKAAVSFSVEEVSPDSGEWDVHIRFPYPQEQRFVNAVMGVVGCDDYEAQERVKHFFFKNYLFFTERPCISDYYVESD